MTEKRVVLITGASTGIGRAVADHLAVGGFAVFGTSRRPAGHDAPRGWELVELDVRSTESAARCVRAVLDRAGRIDALVNNAGFGLGGAAEEATVDQVRAEFETNFFGAVRLIKAVLPFMRGQAGGHIINISSGNAAVRLPFSSYYVASKCALEGFSSCLRRELRPLGVQVSVIAPAFLKSRISDTIQMGAEPVDAYEPWKTMWQAAIRRSVRRAADPRLVAGCVARILRSRRPRELYLVGPGLRLARWARRWLPEDLFYWGLAKALRTRAK